MKRERCKKTGKVIFQTSGEATRELERAQRLRASGEYGGNRFTGAAQQGRVERRVHPCMSGESSCGGWHLTADAVPRLDLVQKPRRRR